MTTTDEASTNAARVRRTRGEGWTRLVALCAIVNLISTILLQMAGRFVGPSLVVFDLAMILGLWLLRRPGGSGVVVIGVFGLLNVVLHAGINAQVLSVPAAWAFSIPTLAALVASIISVPAAAGAFRGSRTPWDGPPRVLALVMAGVIVLGAVGAATMYATRTNDVAVSGDLIVDHARSGFSPSELTAPAGTVTIAVTNSDALAPAVFKVKGLDVKAGIPPHTTRRVTFTAEPGTYQFEENGTLNTGTLILE